MVMMLDHCCRLGDCHPPPHRTGWGYEYEYDNGRGGRSPPLADTSKCSAERAIQMFNRLRWLRLQVAPEDKPEGRATVCGTIGPSPPSWRIPTLASGNAATPEFRQTPYRDPASRGCVTIAVPSGVTALCAGDWAMPREAARPDPLEWIGQHAGGAPPVRGATSTCNCAEPVTTRCRWAGARRSRLTSLIWMHARRLRHGLAPGKPGPHK